MFCIYCGAENPEDSVFCKQCGKRQPMATHPQTGARVLPSRPLMAETGGVSEPTGVEQELVGQLPSSQISSASVGPDVVEQVL